MKQFADSKRREVTYQVGNWVLLKLRPRRQGSAKGAFTKENKLAKRFYGPFKVLEHIGSVAYRLQLPPIARIHPVFHCSVLKRFHGSPLEQDTSVPLPTSFLQDQPVISPLAILDQKRIDPTGPWQVLVQWHGLSPDDTSWEDWDQLHRDYHLEGKVNLQGTPDDSITGTQVQLADSDAEQAGKGEQKVQSAINKASSTKRRITKPTYLRDYV